MLGDESVFPRRRRDAERFNVCSLLCVSAPLRDLVFVTASWSSCFNVERGGRRSEEEQGAEVVGGQGARFPLRRRDAESVAVCFVLGDESVFPLRRGDAEWFSVCSFLCVSAPLRDLVIAIAAWSSCNSVARGGGGDRRKSRAPRSGAEIGRAHV